MKKLILAIAVAAASLLICGAQEKPANPGRFKALMYYTENTGKSHVVFARQSIDFFDKLTNGRGWTLDKATSIAGWTDVQLAEYSVIICPDGLPASAEERPLFEHYMDNGGGCMVFHAAARIRPEADDWPWLLDFLGCGLFKGNNWPPQPVLLRVDKKKHPVTRNLPVEFVVPACEWYQYQDNLRAKKNIEVLLSVSPKNYPLGLKEIVTEGDFPVVWTNKNYRMIYLNIGHGDEEFTDATQNLLLINAFRWLVSTDPAGNPFDKPITK